MQMFGPSPSHVWVMIIPAFDVTISYLDCGNVPLCIGFFSSGILCFYFIPQAHQSFSCCGALFNSTLNVAVANTNMFVLAQL
uniref:Uncharacterized protein n=1 Tax=Rhizophora mucronata TaxID=61149 RepID=A0A2P2NPH9_RHIMU